MNPILETDFISSDYHPKTLHYPRTILDFEKSQIQRHAFSLNYKIELIAQNQDFAILQFTEDNLHKSKIHVYDKIKVCSCKEYSKKELGYCKHLSVLDSILADRSSDFRKQFLKIQTNLNTTQSKTHVYKIWDSLESRIISLGSGSIVSYCPNSSPPLNLPTCLIGNLSTCFFPTSPYTLPPDITLFDYQHDILGKMLNSKRSLCCMVMGAGKTLTSIAGIKELNTTNCLIVAPKSVMKQWQNEIHRTLGIESVFLSKKNIDSYLKQTDKIGICTYQTLNRNVEKLKSKSYKLIIADEIQYVRNEESSTWHSLGLLQSEYFWGLSGTLIENRLDDLYTVMHLVDPSILGVKWKYESKFKKIRSITRNKILFEHEVQNTQELKKLIENNVFTYDKIDVKPIIEKDHIVDLSINARKEHNNFVHMANTLIAKSLSSGISHYERLMIQAYQLKARQCCNTTELIDGISVIDSQKINKILEIIKDVCITQNKKLVVYSEWTTMLSILERDLIKNLKLEFVRFDGSMSQNKRFDSIEKFKTDPKCKIFFSSDAGGLGIDGLQFNCSDILHTELPWNPAKIDQRNGRLNRLGQTKQVTCHRVITKNSIESKIQENLVGKKSIRTDVLSESANS